MITKRGARMIQNRDYEREFLRLKALEERLLVYMLTHGTMNAKQFDKIREHVGVQECKCDYCGCIKCKQTRGGYGD